MDMLASPPEIEPINPAAFIDGHIVSSFVSEIFAAVVRIDPFATVLRAPPTNGA